MKRLAAWSLVFVGVAASAAAVFVYWHKPRALLEQRRLREETRRAIAAEPFVRAKADSGYALVTGRRCAPLDPDTSGIVEFCLEKKAKSGDVLYTFERYGYDSRDSAACRVKPRTGNGWECLP